jgi:hypothetical protein
MVRVLMRGLTMVVRFFCGLAALTGAVLVVACSTSTHPAPTLSAARPPSRTAPAAPVTVTAASAAPHSLKSRLVARISVDNPDGLVEVGGQIWVKTDDGRVVRIDPHSNKVTASIKLDTAKDPNHYCQGIGTDGTAVWACTASDSTVGIVRIDPNSLTTGKTIAVNKIFDQLTLPHTARGIWVLSGTGETVTVVDAHGTMTSYPLGARCQQLAASETVVVATCPNDNTAVVLDPRNGKIRGRIHLSAPRITTVAHGKIWIDTSAGLTRLSAGLRVEALFPNLIVGLDGDLAPTQDALWVRTSGCVLWRIDRNTVTDRVTPAVAISAGSLLVTANAVWASANNEGAILRLRR